MTTNSFDRIPKEMHSYQQWVCWCYVEKEDGKKPDKVPYNPRTGEMANVNKPATWCSFEEALAAATAPNSRYNGIGFVLSKDDPYTIIDLDDTDDNQENHQRQVRVYQEFDSYCEVSPSGKGWHIIVKADIPNGRRRSAIELYPHARFMTMTGIVCNNKPIEERQTLTELLWQQMGGTPQNPTCYIDAEEEYRDEEIIEKATKAKNGEKFKALFEGNWQGKYPSQSEAEQAFVNIVGFYTQNRGQIKRIFRDSPYGQRKKAYREDYLDRTINKAFDNILPPINIENMVARVEQFVADEKSKGLLKEQAIHLADDALIAPKGLLPAITQFILGSSPYCTIEIAWAGAMALMAGICGRSYNISETQA